MSGKGYDSDSHVGSSSRDFRSTFTVLKIIIINKEMTNFYFFFC